MKTATSRPAVSAPTDGMANGENQDRSGVMAPGPAWPVNTRTSATAAKMASVTTSAVSSQRWVLALTSMPMTQIQVISAIQMTPTIVTAHILLAADCQPNSRNV